MALAWWYGTCRDAPHPRNQCWEEKTPPRDPVTGELRADFVRFPAGMKALGDYIHGKGLSFAIYSAESAKTCGGYPASEGHESLDAQTFASWGVGEAPFVPACSCEFRAAGARLAFHLPSSCALLGRLHQGRRMRG